MKTVKQQIDYFSQHPANCLSHFMVQAVSLEDIKFDDHRLSRIYPSQLMQKINTSFSVNCSCGCKQYFFTAEAEDDVLNFYEGLIIPERFYLKCLSCGKQALLFDALLNGYDAEVMKIKGSAEDDFHFSEVTSTNRRLEGDIVYQCVSCGNSSLEVFARFEYPVDLFEDSTFSNREQDFFSWFTIIAKCSSCSSLYILADFGCE
jgi:hypothetical protein